MKYWEIIAEKLIAAGWTWGYSYARWAALDCTHTRKTIRRYIVESDELLNAFMELDAMLPVIVHLRS